MINEQQDTKNTEIWLVRHGETAWSLSGAHTGRSDIDLTEEGRRQAAQLQCILREHSFSLVLSSPRHRAIETSRLAGFGEVVAVDENLAEWDYGVYEGRTTADIRKDSPGWSVWTSTIEGGESLAEVGRRAQLVLERASAVRGNVLVFSHAHFLRILAACWIGLPPDAGRLLALNTASLSILGYERDTQVLRLWNRSF